MQIKKTAIISIITLFFSTLSYGQNLSFTINNLGDTTVHMIRYLGEKMYYADTAEVKGGVVKFDGSKHETGMYALFLPGQKMLDFVHVQEDIDFRIEDKDRMAQTLTIKKSKMNMQFYKYVDFMIGQTKKRLPQIDRETASDAEKKAYDEKNKKITEDIVAFQKEMVAANKGNFVGDLINISVDIIIPDAPVDENGEAINPDWKYYYFIEHYWDNVNLKSNAIVRTPTFHKKLENYMSKNVLLQIPDTLIKYADKLIEKTLDSSLVFQYVVTQITSKAGKSDLMGMENVYVHMIEKYYDNNGKTRAFWMSEDGLKKLIEEAYKLKGTLIGDTAPRLILPDSTEKNWIDFYKIDAEYKVLYFWEATCGHCKKSTPKLQKLYAEKLKERNVEVYAIGKAMDENFELWKNFIIDNNLTFTNVGLTKSVYEQVKKDPYELLRQKVTTVESINYQTTYNVYSTPRIYVLDKDNVILYKRISIAQLEDILDKLQGVPEAEKLYPIEEEDPEERESATTK